MLLLSKYLYNMPRLVSCCVKFIHMSLHLNNEIIWVSESLAHGIIPSGYKVSWKCFGNEYALFYLCLCCSTQLRGWVAYKWWLICYNLVLNVRWFKAVVGSEKCIWGGISPCCCCCCFVCILIPVQIIKNAMWFGILILKVIQSLNNFVV